MRRCSSLNSFKELKGATTLCGRQSESQGSHALFFSESGPIGPADGYKRRVAAMDRAAQGSVALAQVRRTHVPVQIPPAISIREHIVRVRPASPSAGRSHAFCHVSKSWSHSAGLRSFRRRSASCRSAFPVLPQLRFRPVQRPGKGRHGSLAGCFFCPGSNITNTPHVGHD